MKKPGAETTRSWIGVLALAIGCLASAIALAQSLGASSTSNAPIRLEKRTSTKASVAVGVPGRGAIPVLLPEAVASALVNKRNASFPLCVAGTTTSGITISQPSGQSNSTPLVSSSGSRVTYNVGVTGKQAGKQNDRQPAPAAPTPTCATGSLVEVQISITDGTTFASSALFGVIPIPISTE